MSTPKRNQCFTSHSNWWLTVSPHSFTHLSVIYLCHNDQVHPFSSPFPPCLFFPFPHAPSSLALPLYPPLSFPRASSPPSSLPDLCRFLIRVRDAGLLSGVKWPADSAEHWALHRWPWAPYDLSDMLTMNLEGLEMIAVLVVVVLFVKVLEQFGLLESGYDGKGTAKSFLSWHSTTCCWKFVKAECSLLQ